MSMRNDDIFLIFRSKRLMKVGRVEASLVDIVVPKVVTFHSMDILREGRVVFE